MDKSSLHDLAAKLHAELTAALPADPKSRESLSEMMNDINRLIDARSVDTRSVDKGLTDKGTDAPASTHGSLPDKLERIAVQFEAAHPTLAASARRLVDLLGEVGI
jgi:Domain of unknown function (DUF4404)